MRMYNVYQKCWDFVIHWSTLLVIIPCVGRTTTERRLGGDFWCCKYSLQGRKTKLWIQGHYPNMFNILDNIFNILGNILDQSRIQERIRFVLHVFSTMVVHQTDLNPFSEIPTFAWRLPVWYVMYLTQLSTWCFLQIKFTHFYSTKSPWLMIGASSYNKIHLVFIILEIYNDIFLGTWSQTRDLSGLSPPQIQYI